MTRAQIEQIKKNLETMQVITKATKDTKERYYYYGQIDGILGFLEMLGIEIDN